MSKTDPTLRTVYAVHKHFGVDKKAVNKWLAKEDWPGLPNKASAIQAWYDRTIGPHHNSKVSLGQANGVARDPSIDAYRNSKALDAAETAATKRIKRLLLEDYYIPKDQHETAFQGMIGEVREWLHDMFDNVLGMMDAENSVRFRVVFNDFYDRFCQKMHGKQKHTHGKPVDPAKNSVKARAVGRRFGR